MNFKEKVTEKLLEYKVEKLKIEESGKYNY